MGTGTVQAPAGLCMRCDTNIAVWAKDSAEMRMIMEIRMKEHPILGVQEKGREVIFYFDGQEIKGYEGEPIAAALKAAGVMVHRYTKKEHKPRGIFCAIGRCTDCVMVVDGKPNVRTCVTPLREGMNIQTQDGVTALQ